MFDIEDGEQGKQAITLLRAIENNDLSEIIKITHFSYEDIHQCREYFLATY